MTDDWQVYILFGITVFAMLVILFMVFRLFEPDHSKDKPVVGTIIIETSDPDGPFLFLDLSMPVDQIGTYSEVLCKVDTNGVIGKESE